MNYTVHNLPHSKKDNQIKKISPKEQASNIQKREIQIYKSADRGFALYDTILT